MQAAMNGTADEVHDWRCVSQHHTLTLIERAVDGQRLIDRFAPDLLVAAQDHALVVASQLADVLGARKPPRPTVLTHTMQLFDIAAHPYNPHAEAWTGGTLSGKHILAVDVVDSTRSTLSAFIAELQARVEAERGAAQAAGTPWADPHVGVFVLHNKRRPKAADLPAEVMDGRYFAGEEVDNVAISYPFRAAAANVHQPSAHGDHEHRWAAAPRRSLEERPVVHRSSTPPVHEDQRILSTHYVEEIIEKAVVQQQLLSSFQPHLLIAATDDSVAPARILRHHLLLHGHTSRVLTSTLDLYDEHANPYNPVMPAGEFSNLSGKQLLVVEKVDNTRTALTSFLEKLRQVIREQRAAAGATWQDPVVGVFVLNEKDRPKPQLPQDLVSMAHFYAAETGAADVHLVYPFNLDYRVGSLAAQ